jgi:RHS repeat-associated protein
MTSKTQGPSSDTWTYQFDANNRLTSVQDRATAGGTLLSAVTYVYDVKGNRVEEDTWSSGGGNTVTRFAYDRQNAFADLNSSNALVTRRLYQDGVDTLFARISAAGAAVWYLTDRLGSVRGMVDASGTPQATIAYDGFGNVTSNSNSGFTDRYLFTARELDSATGLQYNRARYYDATIGKWTQRDPIGFEAEDVNLYRFVANSPGNSTDTTGTDAISTQLSFVDIQIVHLQIDITNRQNTLDAFRKAVPNPDRDELKYFIRHLEELDLLKSILKYDRLHRRR